MRRRSLLTPESGGNYANQYLTFRAIESGTFRINNNATAFDYSIDSGATWNSLSSGTSTPTISAGQTIMWKATAPSHNQYYGIGRFSSTNKFSVEGNILSLLWGDNFKGQYVLYGSQYVMKGLFGNCTNLTTAENLEMPATILRPSAYVQMFSGCTSLTMPPKVLPAIYLDPYCYSQMFYGCTSLIKVPEIKAEIITQIDGDNLSSDCSGCCRSMFDGCTSLTTVPSDLLRPTTMAINAYAYMFQGCTSLTTAPSLPATTLGGYCYQYMFGGCTSLTTAPSLPATTLASYCYYGMFLDCTSLTTAPSLPATTLANYCYYGMFQNCTSLTTAPSLPAATLKNYCYGYMFYGCSKLNNITCLALNISATNCTNYWVVGVASSGTFEKRYNNTSWTRGSSGIPTNWTVNARYSNEYFTIVSLADSNTIGWKCSYTASTSYYKSIYVSTDGGETWTAKQSSSGGTTLATLNNGDKMLVKYHSATSYGAGSYWNYFTSTQDFDAEGNIMSLIIDGDFTTATTISSIYTFFYLFYNCSKLKSAENLILPATTLASYCYNGMFFNCTSLTIAPELPASTLAFQCYRQMFYLCRSLTTAPSLLATTLASYCYDSMFYSCTSLTTAPELPATTLAYNCYGGMFQGCTSLTTAPELPATRLMAACYIDMFANCTSLHNITCLALDISATNCTTGWVSGVASSGTFTKAASMTSWTTGTSGIPSGWSVQDAT